MELIDLIDHYLVLVGFILLMFTFQAHSSIGRFRILVAITCLEFWFEVCAKPSTTQLQSFPRRTFTTQATWSVLDVEATHAKASESILRRLWWSLPYILIPLFVTTLTTNLHPSLLFLSVPNPPTHLLSKGSRTQRPPL